MPSTAKVEINITAKSAMEIAFLCVPKFYSPFCFLQSLAYLSMKNVCRKFAIIVLIHYFLPVLLPLFYDRNIFLSF
jgi:hypothetical protein